MQRLNKSKKLKLLLKHKIFRDLTIKEMVSRFQGHIIAHQLKLFNDDEINPFEVLTKIYKKDTEYSFLNGLFNQTVYNEFEPSMLIWSSLTGEMRNHQSMSAHVDGNKSHEIETITLYTREKEDISNEESNLCTTFNDGFLYFPLDGLIIRYKCGYEIIHCNLTDTLHLSDLSRDIINWSRVHGP